ncbi:hypothetical protein CHUAL_008306 [Chamberlinius hualienensis]
MRRDNRIMATIIAIATLLHIAHGVLLVDEDKRQGLIPFPRVGRNLLNYFQYPLMNPGELMEQPQDSFTGPSEFFVRYSRSDRAFTPRLGRRKRSTSDDDDSYNLNNKVIQLSQLLRKSPWTIITFKGVDKKMAFSPRLGRAMVPRLGKKRSDEEVDKRAPAFAPRLGRGHMIMDDDDEDTFNVDTRAAFSPRLGRANNEGKVGGIIQTRASAFAPRLGRSDLDLNNNEQPQQQQQQQPQQQQQTN